MKICYLSAARIPTDWGHVLQILQMCEAFAKAGHEVTLVCPRWVDPLAGADAYAYAHVQRNFKIVRLPRIDLFYTHPSAILYWLRTVSFLLTARAYLLLHRFDVVYTREFMAPLLVPGSVWEMHHPPKRSRLTRLVLARIRGLVVISEGMRQEMLKRRYPAERIIAEQDAVRIERFEVSQSKEEACRECGLPADKYRMGYVGTLKTGGQEKGVGCAIRALASLPEDVVFCVVGGEDDDIAEYRALAEELGVVQRVLFLGKVPHEKVPLYLRAMDMAAAVWPDIEYTRRFMSPLKVFEYMAAELPIVLADLPTLREVLDDENAIFVPPSDHVALAKAVSMLRTDPARAKRLGKSARQRALEFYTWQKRAERIARFAARLASYKSAQEPSASVNASK